MLSSSYTSFRSRSLRSEASFCSLRSQISFRSLHSLSYYFAHARARVKHARTHAHVSINKYRLKIHNISYKILINYKKLQKMSLNMTLRELIINTLEEESENLLDKELTYFIKYNPDGTIDLISINAIGISDQYLLLSNKCPNCNN